jgi:hypothetical protein
MWCTVMCCQLNLGWTEYYVSITVAGMQGVFWSWSVKFLKDWFPNAISHLWFWSPHVLSSVRQILGTTDLHTSKFYQARIFHGRRCSFMHAVTHSALRTITMHSEKWCEFSWNILAIIFWDPKNMVFYSTKVETGLRTSPMALTPWTWELL